MIKSFNPLVIVAGLLSVSAFLIVGFVGLNTVIYAVIESDPVVETIESYDGNLISKVGY